MPTQQKRPRDKRSVSVFKRMLGLFMLVIVLDGLILLALLYGSGTFERMHQNALSMLTEVTRNKFQILESKMTTWSDLEDLCKEIDKTVSDALQANGKRTEDMSNDPSLNAQLTMACAQPLITHIRNTDISGVFMVINGMGVPDDPDSYAGMYVRDSDASNNNLTKSDLHMLRGLPPLSRETGLTLDSFWQAAFRFEDGEENAANDYFYKPIQAYQNSDGMAAKYCGYWSGCFSMHENDSLSIITYSRPLVDAQGNLYGVIGIEINTGYIASIINNRDYSERDSKNSYFLGFSQDGGMSYEKVLTSGAHYQQFFGDNERLVPKESFYSDADYITVIGGKSPDEITGVLCPLSLYRPNTAYSGDLWTLIGLQESSTLFELEDEFRRIVIAVAVMGLALGLLVAILSARSLSRPIEALARQLRSKDRNTVMALEPTGLAEIDVLADTIAELNRFLVEDASRISKIITLSGLPVGAFERRADQNTVFCSNGFFQLLGCSNEYNESNYVDFETFKRIMNERLGTLPPEDDNTFLLNYVDERRYIRLKVMYDANSVLGTLLDVTEEVENRRRIERERDYDLLTGIFNRRAFETRCEQLFSMRQEKLEPISALLMIDMDNLKAVNDSYGHDCGDLYIREFAKALHLLCGERSILARRSGDEFYLLYYGYQSRNEIRAIVKKGWQKLLARTFDLPDGSQCRLRASAGIAWYPDNADEFIPLLHDADFAMYRVKKSAKGTVEEFDQKIYDESGYLFNGTQALDRLLEEKLVRYMLQPIVSAEDGRVHGYEMLMRPQVAELPSPMAVLNLAQQQGKLYQVEYLTWDVALETAERMYQEGRLTRGTKLFVNSIANQTLNPTDEGIFCRKYKSLLGDLVLEITESEHGSDICTNHKIERVQEYGGTVAIDDFGTGYNSDVSLINIDAAYVKLDISFVRNSDKQPDKRALISNVVKYTRSRNIAVIAEGVETYAEMETLSRLGVDYFQGYYVGRPAYMPEQPPEKLMQEISRLARKYKSTRVKMVRPH